ncbi:hypothetical protein BC940DRAFT_301434 [Gongronella butleri]|nr:hypothetical protein BC940DRAFT_301434 [Gongronella butleri]
MDSPTDDWTDHASIGNIEDQNDENMDSVLEGTTALLDSDDEVPEVALDDDEENNDVDNEPPMATTTEDETEQESEEASESASNESLDDPVSEQDAGWTGKENLQTGTDNDELVAPEEETAPEDELTPEQDTYPESDDASLPDDDAPLPKDAADVTITETDTEKAKDIDDKTMDADIDIDDLAPDHDESTDETNGDDTTDDAMDDEELTEDDLAAEELTGLDEEQDGDDEELEEEDQEDDDELIDPELASAQDDQEQDATEDTPTVDDEEVVEDAWDVASDNGANGDGEEDVRVDDGLSYDDEEDIVGDASTVEEHAAATWTPGDDIEDVEDETSMDETATDLPMDDDTATLGDTIPVADLDILNDTLDNIQLPQNDENNENDWLAATTTTTNPDIATKPTLPADTESINDMDALDISQWLGFAIIILLCFRIPSIKRFIEKPFKKRETSSTLPYHAVNSKELD